MTASLPKPSFSGSLLMEMTRRDFQSKYIGSLFGLFWTVLNPLLLLVIFTFVFTVIFRARFAPEAGMGMNALYLLAGILPWVSFQEGLGRATVSLLEHRHLVTRVRFPVAVVPAVPVLSAVLSQLIGLTALLVLAAVYAQGLSVSWFWLPVLVGLQILFTLGLAFFLAGVNVFFRDTIHLVPVLLLVWMYGTPVFYPSTLVPENYQLLLALNPMAHLVEGYRRVILEAGSPAAASLPALSAGALLSITCGYFFFRRWSVHFADRL